MKFLSFNTRSVSRNTGYYAYCKIKPSTNALHRTNHNSGHCISQQRDRDFRLNTKRYFQTGQSLRIVRPLLRFHRNRW